jgi:hypothetical protein
VINIVVICGLIVAAFLILQSVIEVPVFIPIGLLLLLYLSLRVLRLFTITIHNRSSGSVTASIVEGDSATWSSQINAGSRQSTVIVSDRPSVRLTAGDAGAELREHVVVPFKALRPTLRSVYIENGDGGQIAVTAISELTIR